jgi:uncharacterized protein YndB with AHSA1/START domain
MVAHHHTAQIHIGRSVDDVFAAVADPNTHPQWQSQVIRVETSDPAPLSVGASVTDVVRMFGREMSMTFEVTQSDPPHAVSIRMTSGPIRPVNRMTFSSHNDGTLLKSETTVPGMMGFLMGRTVKSGQQRNFQKLKELLEAGEL